MGVGNITWEEFGNHLLDSIKDKQNRINDAESEYAVAAQRPNQKFDDFLIYIEKLEETLGIDDDSERTRHLRYRLLPDLQDAITRSNRPVDTRQELISTARTIEGIERGIAQRRNRTATWGGARRGNYGDVATAHPPNQLRPPTDSNRATPGDASWSSRRNDKGSFRASSRPGFSWSSRRDDKRSSYRPPASVPSRNSNAISGANNTPIGREADTPRTLPASGECFKCGEKGHIIANCPKVQCFNCEEWGHFSTSCPKPKRTGNGPARS